MRNLLVLPCILALVLMTSCAAPSTPKPVDAKPSATAAQAPSGPQRGGTLRGNYANEPGTWDLHQGVSVEGLMGSFLGDTLLGMDPVTFEITPRLAERWEYTDPTTLVLHLRQGVKFQNRPPVNGREFTAKDAVYNLNRIMGKVKPGTWPRKDMFKAATSVKELDKYRVEIKLQEPFGPLLTYLATYWNVMFAPEVDQLPNALNDPKNMITTGPFMVEDHKPGVSITLVRNPDYWVAGTPYLDRVEFTKASGTAVVAGYRSNQFDLGFGPAGGLNATQQEVLKKTNPEMTFRVEPVPYPSFVYMDLTKPPFTDVRVRRAIFLAIDRDEILQKAGSGVGHISSVISWKDFPGYVPNLQELTREPGFRKPKDADLAEAKRLLAEAGFASGLKIEADTVLETLPEVFAKPLEIIQQQLTQIGITIKINVYDNTTFDQRAESGQTLFTVNGWRTAMEIDDQLYNRFHSSGGRHHTINDPELDRLIELQRHEQDPKKRAEHTRAAIARIHEMAWVVPLYTVERFAVIQPWVHDFDGTTSRGVLNPHKIWIDPIKKR